MTLTPGTILGPYEILSLLGQGGMGSVYKARDPRLGRFVAIKVAREQFNERFDREARAVAALNHNNICTLYDIGPNYLVMEYIEGPTLTARINQGAMTIDDAMPILKQLVDGIEAAHEKNIYHRDLKPDNIKITPEGVVKILDFGLAKAADPITVVDDPANAPTLRLMTVAGAIMGTPSYMSPEQASGKPVDKRADIWAFGVIVWEMLTRSRLFGGETIAHTMSEVLSKEFTLDGAPHKIRPLLGRCLIRDARKRMRDIGEARIALEKIESGESETPVIAAPRRAWLPWALAGLFAVAAIALAVVYAQRPPESPKQTVRMLVDADIGPQSGLSISQDGRVIAYITPPGSAGDGRVALRVLDQAQPSFLEIKDRNNLFLSPDGRSLGYTSGSNGINILSLEDKTTRRIENTFNAQFAHWGDENTILARSKDNDVHEYPLSAGLHPRQLSAGVSSSGSARLIPGTEWAVLVHPDEIWAHHRKSGAAKNLKVRGDNAAYVEPGFLVYWNSGRLYAAPFNAQKAELSGEGVVLLDNVERWDVSRNGNLVYTMGETRNVTELIQLDKAGAQKTIVSWDRFFSQIRLSPDGSRALLATNSTGSDVMLFELERGVLNRMTTNPMEDEHAVWSPDGKRFAYSSAHEKEPVRRISILNADGSGGEELVWSGAAHTHVDDWTADGAILFDLQLPKGRDIWIARRQGSQWKSEPWLATEFAEEMAQVSPDGKWVAYRSAESGPAQVYVRGIQGGAKWQISNSETRAGHRWSRDGKEIYFMSQGSMMAVAVNTGNATANGFRPSSPRALFPLPAGTRNFDVTPDGKFLCLAPRREKKNSELWLTLNWSEELKRKFKK
ncbi:MAG: serine/threonine-protein kinase [Candidatus Solibacter usitatus]|nr:serine/threonine-protein kinase [Candidatus Solibacter usitatus]